MKKLHTPKAYFDRKQSFRRLQSNHVFFWIGVAAFVVLLVVLILGGK